MQEFQSKKLMQQHGVNVQRFRVAETKEDAAKISTDPTFSVLRFAFILQSCSYFVHDFSRRGPRVCNKGTGPRRRPREGHL